MDAKSLRKFRIDLTRTECRSIRITFETALAENIAANLGFSPQSSRFKSFFEQYTRNGTKHSIALRITRRTTQDIYAIRLSYEIIDPALSEYYHLRGWNQEGIPSKQRLEEIRVDKEAIEKFEKYLSSV